MLVAAYGIVCCGLLWGVFYRERLLGKVEFGFLRTDGSEVTPFRYHTRTVRFTYFLGLGLAATTFLLVPFPILFGIVALLSLGSASAIGMDFIMRKEAS